MKTMTKRWMRNGLLLCLGAGAGVGLGSVVGVDSAHACSCVEGEIWTMEVAEATGPDASFWTEAPQVNVGHSAGLLDFEKNDSHCRVRVK